MFPIQCPECNAETNLSLDDAVYEGPYRCWKCRGLFRVKIADQKLKFHKPVTESELEEETDS
jgi:hypothetical protein